MRGAQWGVPIALIVAGVTLLQRTATWPPVAGASHADPPGDEQLLDPLGPNAACYVCHVTFVDEPLAVDHLHAKITCIDCHGTSQGHANDERIGATPPDIVIKRTQLNRSCRKCHETHDVRPEAVIARWIVRSQWRARHAPKVPLQGPVVCTDCHGSHRVSRAQPNRAPQVPPATEARKPAVAERDDGR